MAVGWIFRNLYLFETMWNILILLLIFSPCILTDELEEVVTVIPQGKLVGIKLYTAVNNEPYFAFSNIPYAKAPLGNLRFKPPQDAPSWRGIRVLKYPPVCYQWVRMYDVSTFFGQEDCLYLNVFTPKLNETAKLPVVVCIHGGDFQRGSSYECAANNFIEQNIVFVSFNYRLGIFGFMSTGNKMLPGNYGLKDQVAALKWVQKNIKLFGGDADKVTIMGQGAGGSSVHYHMYSPLSKGLFSAAISQSATALNPWAFTPVDVVKNRTYAIANLMKCPNDTTGEILMCLSKIQSKILAEKQPELSMWNSEPNVIFSPTIEPDTVENAFLQKNPWKDKEVNTVPWIIGFNTGEGALKASEYFGKNESLLRQFNNDMDKALPIILTYDVTAKTSDISDITKAIRKFYLKDKMVTLKSAQGLIDLFTDSMMSHGSMKAAAKYERKKYFYLFDHVNQNSYSAVLTAIPGLQKFKMASHGDEIISLFYVPWIYAKKTNIEYAYDLQVSHTMLTYWTNFIKTSDPNAENTEIKWEPMKSDKFEYLHISSKMVQMKADLWKERYNFWETLPIMSKFNIRPIKKDEL